MWLLSGVHPVWCSTSGYIDQKVEPTAAEYLNLLEQSVLNFKQEIECR
jgi:hypothetical protein